MRKLVFSCGDPAGIGPEIIRAFLESTELPKENFLVTGPASWLETLPGVEALPVGPKEYVATPGQPDPVGSKLAWEALEATAQACQDGRAEAAVTAPINKELMQAIGFRWPGHTEFFAERWGGEPVMAFSSPSLKVALASWHIPLSSVIPTLKDHPALLTKAVTALQRYLLRQGTMEPRIAVCGLNPHAGENGLLGREENDWLRHRIDCLAGQIDHLDGPFPADTIFWRARQGEFDGVVALYHDQGLIPVKTLEMDEAVNLTLGLPWLRTSPDHGTAFDIAGQGKANPRSFARAVEEALA